MLEENILKRTPLLDLIILDKPVELFQPKLPSLLLMKCYHEDCSILYIYILQYSMEIHNISGRACIDLSICGDLV